jgi:hypothetical protein
MLFITKLSSAKKMYISQASRRPSIDTHILPGDELMMECFYQTTNRSKPTFGGNSGVFSKK